MSNLILRQPILHGLRQMALLLIFTPLLVASAAAQSGDREARAALWDSYKLPDGQFIRFVDRQKGFSFFHPADWKDQIMPDGARVFQPAAQGTNLIVLTEDIPEGYGIANYTSGYLQSLRSQPVVEDSTTVRRVMMSGLEWREVSYDVEANGGQFHQTMWLTAVGARVYGFALTISPGELEKQEPLLKRMVMTVRVAAAGRFDEEFENLRAKFAANSNPAASSEGAAAAVAEDLRAARVTLDVAVNRLTQLFNQSPESAFDLAADADPRIRTAAILALGKARTDSLENGIGLDALLWALNDKDVFASSAAATGLAARGQDGLQALKSKLPALSETPAALVRAGVTFGEEASRELIAALLASDSGKQQLAGMLLALALPKFDQPLPFSKLLSSSQAGQAGDGSLWDATIAVLQKHLRGAAAAGATAELIQLLRGDSEWWAAQALGEIAPPETAAQLERRIAEIDARLLALGKSKQAAGSGGNGGKSAKTKSRRGQPSGNQAGNLQAGNLNGLMGTVESSAFVWVGDPKSKPEDVRLALVRGQIETALRKVNFRANWNKAQTDAERRKLRAEFNENNSDLSDWSESVTEATETAPYSTTTFDPARLNNAPTTGETLFPKHAISYVMSPNFAATMERLDAALSGVQMATVRDQMTFALIYKLLKTELANKTGVSATGDAGKAVGIDLNSPISLASWPSHGKSQTLRSAVALRVTDRARFERLLVTYQEELGDLNTFATMTAALSRFAGLLPAAVPVIFAAATSPEGNYAISKRLPKSGASKSGLNGKSSPLQPFAWMRQEKLGGVEVTVFDKPTISSSGNTSWETMYLAYFGETAIIASSQAALADTLRTASLGNGLGGNGLGGNGGEASIAQSEGFARIRNSKIEPGEIVFFSDLAGLFRSLDTGGELNKNNFLDSFLKTLGAESGALKLSPTSWETVFNLSLGDNQFTGSFQPFKADQLAAPRELLPTSTILYAAATVNPQKLLDVLKKLGADSGSVEGILTSGISGRDKEIERSLEKDLVPQMQGEIAGAILSLKPFFDGGGMPAMVFAAKLKSKELSEAMRSGKLFARIKRLENTTVLGSPVVLLDEEDEGPYAIVTEDYFVLADSVETLKMLDSKDRFSASRDFTRSLQNTPENLALFATYNLEAAFDEASKAMSKGESYQQMLPFISAVVHAFHSQHAFVAFSRQSEQDGLRGHLAVSFDREGRYSIGDLTRRVGEFDVANAIIPTKGLSVIQAPRVETMTLRMTAKGAGVAARVRDDLSRFSWQKIEAFRDEGNDSTVVVTIAARRIPEKLTVKLPVAGEEFAQYLKPTARINSRAPEVVSLARQIAGEDKDAHSVARKIGDWTYKNLKWKKVESDAVETLASREADCLEHSELYVAMARSLGLPARVVTGAALGDGSFGAHAWVEVYLGQWVELDPTWGLMEHVDATHLRFDGDAFTSYAMLNQLELEITAARRTTADFQRDPVRLAKEFSLQAATRDLAFDLPLTVEHTFGADRWNKLDEKQRAAVIKAFERSVKELWETWEAEVPEPVRLLHRETANNQTRLTLLRGDALLRLTLAQRDGAWFITEHENLDDALPEFADALNGALQPDARRGRVFEVSFEPALKHLDRLIAGEGEKPDLLLLKARVLSLQQSQARLEKLLAGMAEKEASTEKTTPPAEEKPSAAPSATPGNPAGDPALELMKQITTRWPDFAPGHLALGRELLNNGDTEDSLNPISKDAEQAIAALQRYAQLVPNDPRPWRDLGQAFEQTEKFDDAENAFRAAIERDRDYLDHHAMLVNFLLDQQALEKAKAAFARMLKTAPEPGEAFEYLTDDEEEFDAEAAKIREQLLLAFPKEVSMSKTALTLLAGLQETQDKFAEAVKSTQRAIAIEAEAEDYETLSRLYRQQRRFPEALNAANQGVKLDDSALQLHFERACSLAQLGRKREAIAALKQLAEGDATPFFNADEPDLQPLVATPEFKAMKDKMKEAMTPKPEKQDEKQSEQTNKPKNQ